MRKPIKAEVRGLQTPRERVWTAIRALKKGFTRALVGDTCNPGVTQFAIDLYMDDLLAGGFIVKVAKGKRIAGRGSIAESDTYDLVREQFEAPRVTTGGRVSTKGVGRLAMWRAIRMCREFDYREIAQLASVEGFEVRPATAKRYVNELGRAGYFAVVRAASGRNPTRLRLVKNTGPIAPVLTSGQGVFDRNTGDFTLTQSAQEVCDGIRD